jgi:hypothetical protein
VLTPVEDWRGADANVDLISDRFCPYRTDVPQPGQVGSAANRGACQHPQKKRGGRQPAPMPPVAFSLHIHGRCRDKVGFHEARRSLPCMVCRPPRPTFGVSAGRRRRVTVIYLAPLMVAKSSSRAAFF